MSIRSIVVRLAVAGTVTLALSPVVASTARASVEALPTCTTTITGLQKTAITVTSGTVCLEGATAGSAVAVSGGATIVVINSDLRSSLQSSGANKVIACNSAFHGTVTIAGSTGRIRFGDDGAGTPACDGNHVFGPVILGGTNAGDGNTGGLIIAGNTIQGPLELENNTAPAGTSLRVEANQIQGPLDCTGNTPAPVDGGLINHGTPGYDQCAGLSKP